MKEEVGVACLPLGDVVERWWGTFWLITKCNLRQLS